MKSFTIAAFAGAATAAWAPPAYGGASSAESSPVASYSAPPAEGYSQPAEYTGGWGSSSTSSKAASTSSKSSPPVYSMPASSSWKTSTSSSKGGYGTGSIPAYSPKPTGGWGAPPSNGTWGHGPGGYGSSTYVTQVVTSYETYCPHETTFTAGPSTYTVTSATTLTITDCPGGCEVTMPVASYTPKVTTEVVTSYTTFCPEATTVTHGGQTWTATESQTLTVCPGDCTVTSEVPATWVVPTYSTVCPSPSAPATVTIGTETHTYSQATTIMVTAPTSYATYTSVISKPATPTSVVIESTTYPISEGTTVTYSAPTQGGITVTAPMSSIFSMPTGGYTPPASTPAGPVGGMPSASYPAASGNGSSPVSPYLPEQTGNGAGKLVAGGAAFAAVVGALFL